MSAFSQLSCDFALHFNNFVVIMLRFKKKESSYAKTIQNAHQRKMDFWQ